MLLEGYAVDVSQSLVPRYDNRSIVMKQGIAESRRALTLRLRECGIAVCGGLCPFLLL